MHTLNVLLQLISVVLQIVAIVQQHRGKNLRGLPPATGDKILRHVTLAVDDGAAMLPHEQTEAGQAPAGVLDKTAPTQRA